MTENIAVVSQQQFEDVILGLTAAISVLGTTLICMTEVDRAKCAEMLIQNSKDCPKTGSLILESIADALLTPPNDPPKFTLVTGGKNDPASNP